MRRTLLLIVAMSFFMLICKPVLFQDTETGIDEVVNFPTTFFNKVTQKVSAPNGRLTIANIDELRLYPKGAQMTTYTYQPLIGITSKCDVGNHISYYEYDAFSRLHRIRDHPGAYNYNLFQLCLKISPYILPLQ